MKRTRLSLAALCAVSLAASSAAAQELPEERTFPAERLRPAMDREGIIDVETGRVPAHLSYDAALWLWYAHNPLVLYRDKPDGTSARVQSLVGSRVGGTLTGQLSLFEIVELGFSLPFVLFQGQGAADPNDPISTLSAGSLQPAGVGDLRISPKFALLNSDDHLLDVAVIPTVTLPTALGMNALLGASPEYMGEGFMTFTPELVVGRFFEHARLAGNLGVRLRPTTESLGLIVTHEVTYRVGGAYRMHETVDLPLELQASIGGQAALGGAPNINGAPLELLAQGVYDIDDKLRVGLGGGLGLAAGYATPDFRVLANVAYAPRAPRVVAPPDRDRDGILDADDRCPEEPEDVDTFEDADGCPDPDNDEDGVPDDNDRCPLDPEDRDDHQDEDGCPDPDNDGDGVADVDDQCVNEPEDRDEHQDEDGCPDPDNDGDGVPDASDGCPMDPEDRDGFEDEDGCPDPDNDKDGISDADDQCPLEPETINGNEDEDGCPDKGKTLVVVTKKKIEILDKVYFATAKAEIRERSFNLLRQVASILKANRQVTKVRIEGHTDSQGNDAYNKDLSDRRAKAVRTFLIEQGINEDRLVAEGFGEERPVADNKTAAGREQNRRVEFNILEIDGKPVEDGDQTIESDDE